MLISLILWFLMLMDYEILSTTVADNLCDFHPCIDDRLTSPILNSTFIKCVKRSHCPISGNIVSRFAISQKDLFHVTLKNISVKQNEDDFLIQLGLSSALLADFSEKGHQTSLTLKISFGEGSACYELFIPYSFFIYFKDDFLLPCFRIQHFYRHELKLVLSTYWNHPLKNITELVFIQAANYSLRNVTEVYRLSGNVFKTTYDFDSENFYLILNRTADSQCLFYHNISIFESSHKNICNTLKPPVHRWVSFSRKSCDVVNYDRNHFTSSQQYCIYAVFKKAQHCELSYPENFIEISFFQLLPNDTHKSKVVTSICEKWNLTMDVETDKVNIPFKFRVWCQFVKCFSSYQFCLYKLKSRKCDLSKFIQIFCYNIFSGFDEEISRVFLNVSSSGCYTIMVLPFIGSKSVKKWTRNYSVFNFTGNEIIKEDEKDFSHKFPNEVLLAMGFCVFIAGFSLWSYSKYKLRSKMKGEKDKLFPGKSFPVENEVVDDIPLLTQHFKEIYIFHSHSDNSIRREVDLLKDFLQKSAEWTVYTLKDKLHEIMKTRSEWLIETLECGCSKNDRRCNSNKGFLFVISAKALHDFVSKNLVYVR